MTMGLIHKKKYTKRYLAERAMLRHLMEPQPEVHKIEARSTFEPPPEPVVKAEPKIIKRIVMRRDRNGDLSAIIEENPPAPAVIAKNIGPTIRVSLRK
jgi:hypothetical protein